MVLEVPSIQSDQAMTAPPNASEALAEMRRCAEQGEWYEIPGDEAGRIAAYIEQIERRITALERVAEAARKSMQLQERQGRQRESYHVLREALDALAGEWENVNPALKEKA